MEDGNCELGCTANPSGFGIKGREDGFGKKGRGGDKGVHKEGIVNARSSFMVTSPEAGLGKHRKLSNL